MTSLVRPQRASPNLPWLVMGCSALVLGALGAPAAAWVDPPLGPRPAPPEEAEPDSQSLERYKRLSLDDLMSIEVTTVSRRPERLSDAASAIQVATGEEIRRSGVETLPQALRAVDNLNVAQKNAHDWGISARGFNTALSNKLLVLLDGRAVYTPLFSGVSWTAQDCLLEDIEQIEVVSGPGGSVWGANAVNGVINVRSRPAGQTQGLFVETAGGPRRAGGAARWGGAIGESAHYRIYGKYVDRGDQRLARGGDAGDGWNRGSGGFRLDIDAGGADRWTVQGDSYGGEDGQVAGGRTRLRGSNVLGRWSRSLGAESDLTVQVYFDRTRFEQTVPASFLGATPLAPAGELTEDLRTSDLDLQHAFRVGQRHGLTWGFGYRSTDDDVGNAPGLAFLPPQRRQGLWSAFLQDEISFGERLEFTVGTKLEHNDNTGFEVGPSIRLQWHPRGEQTLWAAVSRAVRTPSRVDRDLSQPAPPAPIILLRGSPEFDSETVVATELGYRTNWRHGALSISAFYNDYDDLRSTSITPGTIIPFFFANDLEAKTYGLEVRSRIDVSTWWWMRLGYAYLEEDVQVQDGAFDLNAALNETADPRHQASWRSSFDIGDRVALDTALRWVDRLTLNSGPTPGHVPSYAELDLRLGWRLSANLELSLVGENLLHEQHPEYGFPTPARVEIRRTVFGKLTWRQ